MRVGINATCLNDRPSGARQRFIGVYSELFRQLPQTEFTLYEPRDCQLSQWFAGYQNVTGIATPIVSTGRWAKLAAAYAYWQPALRRRSFDIFEGMHLPLFRPRHGSVIMTIHDVRDLYTRSQTMNGQIYRRFLLDALKHSDRIVTVSSSMRDEILSLSPQTPVSVVYNGLDHQRFTEVTEHDRQQFAKRHGLPRDYILSVGHFEPRKNYHRVVEALAILKKTGRSVPLVIIGNDSGEKKRLAARVAELGLQDSVFLLSGLSDLEVRCAYALCALFLFASIYEGFGIPILEAMAAGRPMALSDIPVFREITESKAIYFSCEDAEAIAESIAGTLEAPALSQAMVTYGRQRVKDFGFDRLAGEMAKIYEAASS